MKKFKAESVDMKKMSNIRGGDDITHDTTILLSRKTKQKAISVEEDKSIEIVGTITIDKEK
jgi:hypothetical protein